MGIDRDDLFCLGVVIGTHGLRGDLKVKLHSGEASAILDRPGVFLCDETGQFTAYDVVRAVTRSRDVLLRLRGVDHISLAESLIGQQLWMRLVDLPDLADDEYYWRDLEGLEVVDRRRGSIGTLSDLMPTPAHDIYVVRGPFGEILIPAVDQFIVAVDLEQRRLEVDLLDGFISEPDEV